ncbi:FeoA family protein [Rhodocista pekingensis]|uniref:Ferrous iron transport protein A n=1 Tax=Rhodocista pekingensis TaxID=201185 RepID=A0ABW2KY49_9PROT
MHARLPADSRLRLGDLNRGQRAEVVALDGQAIATSLHPDELERRLLEMGLSEGARIEIMHEGTFGRDPIAVRVNEHTVALRRREARAVMVSPVA